MHPEYPALPGEGAARSVISALPVYFQPVYLKKAYISELPKHPAPRKSHSVRAAALMSANAYRALVFEYVARAQFPEAQVMRPSVFEQAKSVFAVYRCCSLHCFFYCSPEYPEYPALPSYLNFSSNVSSKVSAASSFLNCARALLTP